MARPKIRCGAPKERTRDGVCDRLAATPYCPEHMNYADEGGMFKVVLEDGRVLVVRARRLGDVCDFIDPDVEIAKIV